MPKCKVCGVEYKRTRPLSTTCGTYACNVEYAELHLEKVKAKKAKARRKETKEKLAKLKTPSQLAKDAEHYVNRYVRLRDYHKGCCSCDKPATWGGQWHCSHYISVGASSALRFHLWNMAKSCSQCNDKRGGNITEYGNRMSLERKEFLDNHERKRRFTREYLIRLKMIFAKRCRVVEKRLEGAGAGIDKG